MPAIPSTMTVQVRIDDLPVVRILAERLDQSTRLVEQLMSSYDCSIREDPVLEDDYCHVHMHPAPCPHGEARRFLLEVEHALTEVSTGPTVRTIPGVVGQPGIEVEFPAGTPMDGLAVDDDRVDCPFDDPVRKAGYVLVIRPSSGMWGVEHLTRDGDCVEWGDVSPELDAWYCPACHVQGRISGAWATAARSAVASGHLAPAAPTWQLGGE